MFARYSRLAASIALAFMMLIFSAPARAQITVGGDAGEVSPADPTTWTTTTDAYIGMTSGKTGTVAVAGGSSLLSQYAYLGYDAGSTGSAVVTGQGSSWNSGPLHVGYNGAGTLTVENGGAVGSSRAYLGVYAGSSGSAVVTGQGSSWTNSGTLYLGYIGGAGTLTVENGGTVTTGMLYASASDLLGNGTINTHGLMSDSDLIFDAAHGTNQVLSFGTGGTLNLSPSSAGTLGVGTNGTGSLRIADGVKISSASGCLGYNALSSGSAVVTGQGSSWTNDGNLNVGYYGSGTLTVQNGGSVSSSGASLGYYAGSSGSAVVVTGQGSSWTNSGALTVGRGGIGTLRVDNGGAVSSSKAYIGQYSGSSGSAVVVTGQGSSWNSGTLNVGYNSGIGVNTLSVENGGVVSSSTGYIGNYASGSTGSVVVTGQGSSWTNTGILYVGGAGLGTLTVGNGGKVTAARLNMVDSVAYTKVRVSGNDMIVLGTATSAGTVDNRGKVILYADAFLASATYSPIADLQGRAMTWSGTGYYNAYGGTWDSTAHTFTVAAAVTAASGASSTLATGERLLITDSPTGKRIGASFGTVAANTTFRADWIGAGSFAGIPDTQGIRGAWSFTTNFAGGALISFELGAGVGTGPSDLQLWRYNGTAWTSFAAPDLTYGNDGIANFAVSSFTRYAITVAKHPGDANDDSAVNVVDLGVLAKNYNRASGANWLMGDFSGDGAVNVVDLGVLAKNYDWSGTSAGAIPEPCSVALLALGGLAVLRRRR